MDSCNMVRDDNGKYSLTIVKGNYPIVMQNNLTLQLALDLINEYMYGGKE